MLKYQEIHRGHRDDLIEVILDGSDNELIEIDNWLSRSAWIDGVEWALELWKQNERLCIFFYIEETDVKEFYMAFKLKWF